MTKSNLNIKLFFLIKIILIYLIFSLKSYSDNINTNNNVVVLGLDIAPIKIKIFSSLTCPHCANFHIKVVPISNWDDRKEATLISRLKKRIGDLTIEIQVCHDIPPEINGKFKVIKSYVK